VPAVDVEKDGTNSVGTILETKRGRERGGGESMMFKVDSYRVEYNLHLTSSV
jgi:hypothetical protein